MSIKAFHIFFIVCAVLISLIFAAWAVVQSNLSANPLYSFSGGVAILSAVALMYYGFYFIRKTKALA